MGGSSKSQTIGQKYLADQHHGVMRGPIDRITKIIVDEKVVLQGDLLEGEHLVDKPEIFGGETREGGVSGILEIMMGGPTQGQNSYLVEKLGEYVPGFRRLVSVLFKQMYLGMNPYPKQWEIEGERIHVRQDGIEQWYDEKAAINYDASSILNEPWEYQVIPYHSDPGNTNLTIPTSGWQGSGVLPFDSNNIWPHPTPPGWPTPNRSICWIRKTLYNVPAGLIIQLRADNGCVMFVNGQFVGASNQNNANIPANQNNPFNFTIPNTGTYEIAAKAYSEEIAASNAGDYVGITLDEIPALGDINPIHVIREQWTDPDWGMKNPENTTDDDFLKASADVCFNENLGIALFFENDMTGDEFIAMICKHINAVPRIDPATNLFQVKMIRPDYDVADLIVLNESNIESLSDYNQPELVDVINSVSVSYLDGITNKTATISLQDNALISELGGKVNHISKTYMAFSNSDTASRALLRDLKYLANTPRSCTIVTTSSAAKGLLPGDPFILNFSKHNFSNVVMRVVSINNGNAKKRKKIIVCSEDIFSMPERAVMPPVVPIQPEDKTPVPVVDSILIEVPYFEAVQQLGQSVVDNNLATMPDIAYVGVAAGRPSVPSINARMYTNAGAGYVEQTTVDFCPNAQLAEDLDFDYIASTVTFEIKNPEDLLLGSPGNLFQINGEIFEFVSLLGTTITAKRALFDTLPQSHLEDDFLYFWDLYLGTDATQYVLGETIDVKLQTITGSGTLALGSAPEQSIELVGRLNMPYPPGNLKVNGSYFPATISSNADVEFTWAYRDRLQQTGDNYVDFTEASIGPEAGVQTRIRAYSQFDTLLHTEVTSNDHYTYTIAQEQTDMGGAGGGTVVEQYWDRVGLLMNMNGANGGVSFPDVSGNYALPYGDVKTSTAQYKYGNSSTVFDGVGDYLNLPYLANYDIGAGNFCIECWFRPGSVSVGQHLMDWRDAYSSKGAVLYQWSGGPTKMYFGAGDSNSSAYEVNLQSTTTLAVGTWYHIAVIRNGTTWRLCINGVSEHSVTSSVTPYINFSSIVFGIGRDFSSGHLNGHMQDFRITKSARYTSFPFTPPVNKLGKYVKSANFSDFKLLLTFEGANNDTSVSDQSDLQIPITFYGNAKLTTSQFKYGASSLDLDGAFNSMAWAAFNTSQSGSGNNITVECYARTSDIARSGTIAANGTTSSGTRSGWLIGIDGSGRPFAQGFTNTGATAFTIFAASAISVNTWFHVTLIRNGTTWRLCIDGVSVGTDTEIDILGVSGGEVSIGRDQNSLITWLGQIDEFAIRPSAVYTSFPFTPPASFLPIDSEWSNVGVLMNLDGVDNGSSFENIAEIVKTATVTGNTNTSTSIFKYGTASAYFDGEGDYLSFAHSGMHSAASTVHPFTIEALVYPTAIGATRTIASKRPDGGSTEWTFGITATGVPGFTAWGSSGSTVVVLVASDALLANVWSHVAVSKDGSTWRIFINGELKGTTTQSGAIISNTTGTKIGREHSANPREWLGYIDDIRITLATRYINDFTPPTLELSKYVPAINPFLRFEIESLRDTTISYQKYNFIVTRAP